jgi:glutamate formiminotransferase/formiminotetrahydrofolate cyclodeaminase
LHDAVRPIAEAARAARQDLLALAREDAEAYDAVVAARRLPKATEAEKAERDGRIAQANRRATEIPMRTARAAARLLALLPVLVEKGNPNAASDVGSAALLLEAASEAALLNVGINLSDNPDVPFVGEMQRETARIQTETQRLRDQVLAAVRRAF